MIVKLFSSAKSFKALAAYILHDPEHGKTADRVKWTHTLNLASDDPGLAVDEMLWTFRSADWLKEHAGVPKGGKPLENPVKHFSLNWHHSENPSHEKIIEATESFLQKMGWSEHQALLACHDDRHPHVHVMLNVVHPTTGRALNAGFEKRRAQEWALAYEREHGVIFCGQRLKAKEEREPSPTRESWERMKASRLAHDAAEYERFTKDFDFFVFDGDGKANDREWKALKGYQRDQRDAFFIEGKTACRDASQAVFREVRTEMRDHWRKFYEAQRQGSDKDELAGMKEGILAMQQTTLDERRKQAFADLRQERDGDYAELLAAQKKQRDTLHERQSAGLRSYHLLDDIKPAASRERAPKTERTTEIGREFRRGASEVDGSGKDRKAPQPRKEIFEESSPVTNRPQHRGVKSGLDMMGGLGLGFLGALGEISERLMDGFFGGPAPAQEPASAPPAPEPILDFGTDNAARANAAQRKDEQQASEAERLESFWRERRARTRSRD